MKTLKKKHFKILGLSSLGGTLEFYDFIIFVFFAAYISKNFFPENLSEFWKLFNTYGIFAAGYLARPLGGVIMAHFGDKFGRKNMFMLSILLMVIPTFALAFIPGFESIGYACIVLLVCVRILQGVAIGGELPGAWIFTYEHAPEHQRHTYLGFLTASVCGGILLGSLVFLAMNKIFTQEELYEWAWRVPFFLGGVFGIISVYLRKFLSETPVFEQMKREQNLEKFPLKEVFKRAKLSVIASMLITWVLTGCVIVLILLLPNYMGAMLTINKIEQSYLQMLGIISLCAGCVLSGVLGDKIGIVKTCIIFALGLIIFNIFFFNALYTPNLSLESVAKWYILACFFGGVVNLCPMIMSEIFDAKIKFSGLSLSYNLAYAIAGGFTPQLAFFLHSFALQNLDNILRFSLGFYLLFLGFITLISALMYKKLAKF